MQKKTTGCVGGSAEGEERNGIPYWSERQNEQKTVCKRFVSNLNPTLQREDHKIFVRLLVFFLSHHTLNKHAILNDPFFSSLLAAQSSDHHFRHRREVVYAKELEICWSLNQFLTISLNPELIYSLEKMVSQTHRINYLIDCVKDH